MLRAECLSHLLILLIVSPDSRLLAHRSRTIATRVGSLQRGHPSGQFVQDAILCNAVKGHHAQSRSRDRSGLVASR